MQNSSDIEDKVEYLVTGKFPNSCNTDGMEVN